MFLIYTGRAQQTSTILTPGQFDNFQASNIRGSAIAKNQMIWALSKRKSFTKKNQGFPASPIPTFIEVFFVFSEFQWGQVVIVFPTYWK